VGFELNSICVPRQPSRYCDAPVTAAHREKNLCTKIFTKYKKGNSCAAGVKRQARETNKKAKNGDNGRT
jgi:hypothetical protein